MEIKINIEKPNVEGLKEKFNSLSIKNRILFGGGLLALIILIVSLSVYNSESNQAKREAVKAVMASVAVQTGGQSATDVPDGFSFSPESAEKDLDQNEAGVVKYNVIGTITEPEGASYEIEVHMIKRTTDGAWDRTGSIHRVNQ